MNVYNCWFEGSKGYCTRSYNNKWMFVPDLGQPSKVVCKNLEIDDLVFANPREKDFERQRTQTKKRYGWLSNLLSKDRPHSMAGFLFSNK